MNGNGGRKLPCQRVERGGRGALFRAYGTLALLCGGPSTKVLGYFHLVPTARNKRTGGLRYFVKNLEEK